MLVMTDLLPGDSRNPDYAGRSSALNDIRGALGEVGAAVLLGTDGMGKSAMAAEYARVNAGEYDFIFWVVLERDRPHPRLRLPRRSPGDTPPGGI